MSEAKGIIRQLNNAVLDLQGADYQSFAQPLSKIGRVSVVRDFGTDGCVN